MATATKAPRAEGGMWRQARSEVITAYCSTFAITAMDGMHLRPAAKMAKTAGRFDCEIRLKCNGAVANAKSLMSVMMLEAMFMNEISVITEGDDAREAMAAIAQLFATGFGELASAGAPNHGLKIGFSGVGSQAARVTAVAAAC